MRERLFDHQLSELTLVKGITWLQIDCSDVFNTRSKVSSPLSQSASSVIRCGLDLMNMYTVVR